MLTPQELGATDHRHMYGEEAIEIKKLKSLNLKSHAMCSKNFRIYPLPATRGVKDS
jgi:hypothetical protein